MKGGDKRCLLGSLGVKLKEQRDTRKSMVRVNYHQL